MSDTEQEQAEQDGSAGSESTSRSEVEHEGRAE